MCKKGVFSVCLNDLRGKGGPIRKTPDEIQSKRQARNTRILLTGGTGFLGSHVAAALLKKGFHVILLVRSKENLSAEKRVNRLLDWMGIDSTDQPCLHIVEGELNFSDFRLDSPAYDRLSDQVDEIIHCASDTSFSQRKKVQVEKANVENLGHLLEFAAKSNCSFFHLISTAFVAGKRSGACPEALTLPGAFTNVYEETKHRAELLSDARLKQEGIRLNVYRPSIVCGDSRTGKTLRFNAFYYPVRMLLFLRDLFQKQAMSGRSSSARQLGIQLNEKNVVELPVRIETGNSGGINLIPIDYFTEAFCAIMDEQREGGIFHIVNPETKSISNLVDYTQDFFKMKGIRAVQPESFRNLPPNNLEILFNRFTEAYKPYMKDQRTFEHRNTAAILDRYPIKCPEFDYSLFSTCMQYAIRSKWGSALYKEVN